jgi:predicted class III extradiol MEMO1 family dioxygenase
VASYVSRSISKLKMNIRSASHAGSWYSAQPSKLSKELDEWLEQVPGVVDGQQLPIPNARVIIAP